MGKDTDKTKSNKDKEVRREISARRERILSGSESSSERENEDMRRTLK